MFKIVVSLVASANTIWIMRLAGRSDQRFNIVGLINCCIWTLFTIITASWGLMLLNITLAYTYTQNLRRWRRFTMAQDARETENVRIMKEEMSPDAGRCPDEMQAWTSEPLLRANQCRVCGSVTGEHGFSFDKR